MEFKSKYNINDVVMILYCGELNLVTIESVTFSNDKIFYKFFEFSRLYYEDEIIKIIPGTKVKVLIQIDDNELECVGYMHEIINNTFTLYLSQGPLCIKNVSFSMIKEIF